MQPLTREHVTLGDLVLTSRDDDAGVTWVMGDLSGWGSPGSTMDATQRPHTHGAWLGEGFLPARVTSMSGWVRGDTPEAADEAVDRLIAAASLGDTSLTVTAGTRRHHCTVRRQGEVIVKRLTDWALAWSIQLVAADPRKYAAEVRGLTGLPSASGGLVLGTVGALTVPLVVHSRISTGQVSIVNSGNVESPVTVRFEGPVRGPAVRHVQSGLTVRLSPQLYLGPGEWVDVDMDARQVLAQGIAARNQFVVSRGWSAASPGVNSWAFTAASSGDQARMTVMTRPAWM